MLETAGMVQKGELCRKYRILVPTPTRLDPNKQSYSLPPLAHHAGQALAVSMQWKRETQTTTHT